MSEIDKNIFCCMEEKWTWRKDDTNFKTFRGLSQETELLEVVKPHLEGSGVMVQAGGNCGMQIAKFAEYFDVVYTFEPDPINFYCLVNNLLYDNVIKLQCCLGDNHELVSMTTFDGETGGFYVNKNNGFIPTVKVDDMNLNRCDFIQLDVEGYQLFALKGALNTIQKFKPLICVEFDWLERYGHSRDEISKFLQDLNYEHVVNYTSDQIFRYKK